MGDSRTSSVDDGTETHLELLPSSVEDDQTGAAHSNVNSVNDCRSQDTREAAAHIKDDSCDSDQSQEDEKFIRHENDGDIDDDSTCKPKKCQALRSSCYTFFKPCMHKHYPMPDDPKRKHKIHHAFLCPPHGKLGNVGTMVLTVLLIWGVLWSITGESALPGPNGNFFGLLVLLVCGLLGGGLVTLIKLPPLLGMLIVGCLLRNVPYINVAKDINQEWSSAIRSIALVVILIRAGLGLDPKALKKLSCVVVRLAFTPCLVETITVAIATHLLLGFPWEWGFMLGFVLGAVSPAVVVPSMLSLQEKGLGVDQGIPTLVVASASIDDVLAISGFGVLLGITFSKGDLAMTIIKGPLEALIGVVFGALAGILVWYFPHRKHKNIVLFRFVLLFGGGLFSLFGSAALEYPGAGALGCLTMAFVAALQWRKEGWDDDTNPVADIMGYLWLVFQPLLFGLIGAEIDVSTLDGETIGLGMATLAIGLTFRMVASFLAVFGTELSIKERLFIPLAWLPKATVQAAIGGIALDNARKQTVKSVEKETLGLQILTIAVLSILVTAPIGAAAIAISAPKLLTYSKKSKEAMDCDKRESACDVNNEDDTKV